MTRTEFDTNCEELLTLARKIADGKRKDYTAGSEDVLLNFRSSGERTGQSPAQTLCTHWDKQLLAIFRSLCKPELGKGSEPMEQRFADALNYTLLAYALWKEQQGTKARFPLTPKGELDAIAYLQQKASTMVVEAVREMKRRDDVTAWPPRWYPQSTGELTSASPLPPPTQTFCVIPNE